MPKPRRLIWIGSGVIAALWVGLLTAILYARHQLNRDPPTLLAEPAMTTLWDAPAFSFVDQDGRRTTEQSLRGHPYVADFIFTTCTTACPTLSAKLAMVRRQVASPAVRFVSFSVDPDHDTPAALKAYAAEWGHPDARWRLLSTDPAGLSRVTKGFKVTVAASGDLLNPILHSTLFLLVDVDGVVRGAYDSTDADQVEKLARDLASLARGGATDVATTADATTAHTAVGRGHATYVAMGCVACHGQARIAPPLESVYNSMVRLSDGSTVWADEAYLHESITNPAAKVVAGYLNSMPSYRSHLTAEQTADVVAYVKSLSTNPPGGHGIVARGGRHPATAPADTVAVDPVCHMKVATAAGPQVTSGGRTFHFCSDSCRDRFLADPRRYGGGELLKSAGPSAP